MGKMVRARLVISGRVQGVYFRAGAEAAAAALGVSGWVRNNQDGTVEAVAEGGEDGVKRLIEWCRVGPPAARVDGVDIEWGEYSGEFNGFTARTRRSGP